MPIREIFNYGVNHLKKQPQAAWEMDVSGITLRVERSGSKCYWTKIIVKKGEEEVYELSRNLEERTESFFGSQARKYDGDKNCFIEYLNKTVADEIGDKNYKTDFDPQTEKQYREFLRKILNL
ncbi:MAG: hypothetical protein WA139_03675 [Candidatus Aenigmatarchaeota archaeon]